MSYHVQQNTQQRSIGIAIVIAFHVVLIWALANGLGSTFTKWIPDNITLVPTHEKVIPPEKVTPDEVIIPTNNKTFTDTTPKDDLIFETDITVKPTGRVELITPSVSISKPRLIKATKPEYPTAASRMGEEGTTGLKLFVTADGRVTEATVFSSSGSSRLDDAAIKHALRNWAFTPCMEGDKAVACWHQTKLVWRLEDAKR